VGHFTEMTPEDRRSRSFGETLGNIGEDISGTAGAVQAAGRAVAQVGMGYRPELVEGLEEERALRDEPLEDVSDFSIRNARMRQIQSEREGENFIDPYAVALSALPPGTRGMGGSGDDAARIVQQGGESAFDRGRRQILESRAANIAERDELAPKISEVTGARIGSYEDNFRRLTQQGMTEAEAHKGAAAALAGEKPKTSILKTNLDPEARQAIWQRADDFDFGHGADAGGASYERFRVRSALAALETGDRRVVENEWLSLEKMLGRDATNVLRQADNRAHGIDLSRAPETAGPFNDVSHKWMGPAISEEAQSPTFPGLNAPAADAAGVLPPTKQNFWDVALESVGVVRTGMSTADLS